MSKKVIFELGGFTKKLSVEEPFPKTKTIPMIYYFNTLPLSHVLDSDSLLKHTNIPNAATFLLRTKKGKPIYMFHEFLN